MGRYVALLRAINVGGRTVTMDRLRRVVESLGYSAVETFIASGNVLFDAPEQAAGKLEAKLALAFHRDLGFEVATFVRTAAELLEVADQQPFRPAAFAAAVAKNVAFLTQRPTAAARRRVLALASDNDQLAIVGRELYWISLTRQSDSKLNGAAFEKALGGPVTVRGVSTVERLAAKFRP